jgi:hypothetical protein
MKRILSHTLALLSLCLPAMGQHREKGHAERMAAAELAAAGTPAGGWWRPVVGSTWQWQLNTPVDQTVEAQVYDIDLFDNSSAVVASLHARGRKVICYVSMGTWEDWRPDAKKFPASVLGTGNGWPGEKWLDIRRLDVLGPIMEARLDICKAKGFDAVEPDNMDGYANESGFPLSYQDQLNYNRFVAQAAHVRGLAVGLKNDVEQAYELVGDFDFSVNEQCFQYKECNQLAPFIQAGKPVFNVEYKLSTSQFCSTARAMSFSSMKKRLSLGSWRVACP